MKTPWLLSAVVLVVVTGCPEPMPMPDGGMRTDAGTTTDGGTSNCPATANPATWGMGTARGSSISSDETWTAADSPHRVSTRISVGARLTVEPCAVVLLTGTGQLYLDAAGGKLVAEGTAERPILIQGQATGAMNSTRGVWTTASQGEAMRLAHVTIDGIGDGNDGFGDYAIALQSTDAQTLHVDTVTIRNTYGGGIGFDQRARFSATSRNLTITGTKRGDGMRDGMPQSSPVLFVNPGAVGTLPSGTYTGNEVDHVGVGAFGSGAANLTEDSTWVNRGVPYVLRSGINLVPSMANPTWTLREGVTLKFLTGTDVSNAHLSIGFTAMMGVSARFLVEGTAAQKVTFEALSGMAPAWSGISIFPAARASRINHAVLRHTGLESRTAVQDCSMIRRGVVFALALNFADTVNYLVPDEDTVRNTTIRDAATNTIGFQRSWIVSGNAGAMSVNLLDGGKGNAVEGLTCRQSGFSIFNSAMGTRCAGACE